MVTQHWTDNERHKEPLELNVFGLAEMCLFSNLRTDGFFIHFSVVLSHAAVILLLATKMCLFTNLKTDSCSIVSP